VVYTPLPSIPAGAKAGGVTAWGEAGSGASQNTVMGPEHARSVPLPYSLAFTHLAVCYSHIHTTSMERPGSLQASTRSMSELAPGDSPRFHSA
jgi:hypothetical protein